MLKDIVEIGIPWQGKTYCITANYNGAYLKNTLERHQRAVIAEPVILQKGHGFNKGGVKRGKCPTITANGSFSHNNLVAESVGCAVRSRYINSGDRSKKCSGGTYSAIEKRKDGKANCMTTVTEVKAIQRDYIKLICRTEIT